MNWDKLLSAKRLGKENEQVHKTDYARSQFQRDYDRFIFSSPFRRMQNKTQVFPLPGSVFVHNRLTHSLEVASVGRSLGNKLAFELKKRDDIANKELLNEIGSIVSAACLAHDMGNPPFGHSGEEAIANYFETKGRFLQDKLTQAQWSDLIRFEGNANAFRLLSHQFKGRRPGGFGLTYSTLVSIVKYPYEAIAGKKKFGFFQSEKESYLSIANALGLVKKNNNPVEYCRHPLVYLVEAADDICYLLMDSEDAHKLGILSTEFTKNMFLRFIEQEKELDEVQANLKLVSDKNEQIAYLRALIINKLVNESIAVFRESYQQIMNGNFQKGLVDHFTGATKEALAYCKKVAVSKIYSHQSVVEIEIAGYKILGTLLEEFIAAALTSESGFSKKMLSMIPEQYDWQSEDTYTKILAIIDFVSGMTDVYALDLYRKITGINLPGIKA